MADQAAHGSDEIRIGISGCLLGERVRWNHDHKRDAFLVDTVGKFVKYVSVCPEMEVGMGTPREPVRLVARGGAIRMVEVKGGRDHTDAMEAFAARRVKELAKLDLSGFILKKDSPSCGLERVRIYAENGIATKSGRGLFAQALTAALPQLPIEEEGRLNDPRLRENFFERVFAWRRLAGFFGGRWTVGGLVAFHAREKLLLLAHEPEGYRALGRLVAQAKGRPRGELESAYRVRFMEAMGRLATARRHVNALQHMAGYVSDELDVAGRAELCGAIADFGRGLVPLVVPMTLIKHHVRRLGVDYLAQQTYLDPHPKELMLRNHV
jgi:uncharacterized protein YbgA (DUF1722 family)/uncharacterized protein YbbK (DUF523 family)